MSDQGDRVQIRLSTQKLELWEGQPFTRIVNINISRLDYGNFKIECSRCLLCNRDGKPISKVMADLRMHMPYAHSHLFFSVKIPNYLEYYECPYCTGEVQILESWESITKSCIKPWRSQNSRPKEVAGKSVPQQTQETHKNSLIWGGSKQVIEELWSLNEHCELKWFVVNTISSGCLKARLSAARKCKRAKYLILTMNQN